MELNEALHRIVVGHWRLLVLFLALPVLLVGVVHVVTPRPMVATARVQASSTPPSTDTEADAVMNRSIGIATSSAVVDQARTAAKIDRDSAQLAKEITVTRLGSSAVLELSVSDRDPAVATNLAGQLAVKLVAFLNGVGSRPSGSAINDLTTREQSLQTQRVQIATNLALATSPTDSARLQAQLSTLDQQLSDVQTSLRQAETSGSGNNSAALISTPTTAQPSPSTLGADLGLAGLIGLVAGLLVATVLEVLRPRVADARAFGAELGAPLLGRLVARRDRDGAQGKPAAEDEALLALRRAAAHATVETILLTGPMPADRLTALSAELEDKLAARAPQPVPETPEENRNGLAARPPGHGLWATRSAGDYGDTVTSVAPGRAAARLRVLPLARSEHAGQRPGLVAVVPDLVPYQELRRVGDLVETTGWPLLGVLGDPNRSRS